MRACAAAAAVLTGAPQPPRDPGAVGVLSDLFEAADPAVIKTLDGVLAKLKAAGLRLESVSLDWRAPGFGLLLAVEFATAWGARADAAPERFPSPILSAIERAREVPAARYRAARDELGRARRKLEHRLGGYGALLSPTVPTAVPSVQDENVATSTRFTRIFSALGWPAISVPAGHDPAGRPVGIHVTGAGPLAPILATAALVELVSRPLEQLADLCREHLAERVDRQLVHDQDTLRALERREPRARELDQLARPRPAVSDRLAGTTAATTSSPQRSDGIPTTAADATPG